MSRVLIGIQARSGSTRLPRKAFELISGKTLLDRVIDACKSGANNVRQSSQGRIVAQVAVLTPEGDPIAREFKNRCEIVEGSEPDVLSRYRKAANLLSPAYIVRVTGDCPLLPPFVVSKLISIALMNAYDYVSNVDENARTAIDGADCEVISTRLLAWADESATEALDREHVTTLIRRAPPEWAKIGAVVHHFDHSDLKLSVDTREDLEAVRAHVGRSEGKYQNAVMRFGKHAVHRL